MLIWDVNILLGYDVMLNRRIFERTAAVPTNYTIFFKYVRDKRGGEIAYAGFDVKNCVSEIGRFEVLSIEKPAMVM